MIYTNWDPLESVIVGSVPKTIPAHWQIDPEVKPFMDTVFRETHEDLNGLAQLLEGFGVRVYRPKPTVIPHNTHINGFNIVHAMLPAVPRDQYLVYGETVYQTYTSMPDRYFDSLAYYDIFRELYEQGHNWISQPQPTLSDLEKHYFNIGGDIYLRRHRDLLLWHTATMFKCGDALITNTNGPGTRLGLEWMRRNTDARIIEANNRVNNWGHIDHGFYMIDDDTVIAQGEDYVPEVLRNKRIIDIKRHVRDFRIDEYMETLENTHGKYTLDYWKTYLAQYSGYDQEVAFETNVLVVDSKNVIVLNDQPGVQELVKPLGVTLHTAPLRWCLFWESGPHCVTLDLARRGANRNIIG